MGKKLFVFIMLQAIHHRHLSINLFTISASPCPSTQDQRFSRFGHDQQLLAHYMLLESPIRVFQAASYGLDEQPHHRPPQGHVSSSAHPMGRGIASLYIIAETFEPLERGAIPATGKISPLV